MLRRRFALFLAPVIAAFGQFPIDFPPTQRGSSKDEEMKLPNGRSQRDMILKEEHEKSLQDAAELIKLAGEIHADLDKEGSFVVSLATIKKTEDIEKLAKRIRARLKHS